ncbi:hypothetical protein Sjap_002365 [Stephania japonica]|uniref:Uncharacterized protein n=1 Tax=Stephania japonica TaxID=461633 RepID=A0AAP0PU43_9MAGN
MPALAKVSEMHAEGVMLVIEPVETSIRTPTTIEQLVVAMTSRSVSIVEANLIKEFIRFRLDSSLQSPYEVRIGSKRSDASRGFEKPQNSCSSFDAAKDVVEPKAP